MAICRYCNKEMLTADGCSVEFYTENDGTPMGKLVPRSLQFLDGGGEEGARCHDCNVLYGNYHHVGCDNEVCTQCGGQIISCDCGREDEE